MNTNSQDNLLNSETVSIIVRTANKNRFFLLEKALQSIIDNDYRPLEIIIVIQSQNKEFISVVTDLCVNINQKHVVCKTIINFTSQDQRAKNLNLGLQSATGRYVGFLDDDDILYPNHISKLVHILKSQDFSWVFSDVKLALVNIDGNGNIEYISYDYRFSQEKFSLESLFRNNCILIHSYLINVEKINPIILKFDESFTVAEDYAFSLNLAVHTLPYYLKEVTCEYRIFQDFSNSNIMMNEVQNHPDKNKIKEWSKALWRIEKLKEQLMPNYSSEWISLKLRKYIFYKFPSLKVILQYKLPALRKLLLFILKLDI